MQPNKLSLASLIACVVMFFLPWIEVRCQGMSLVRQTGLQAAVGAVSISEELPGKSDMQKRESGKNAGIAWLVIASGAMAMLALWTAWITVKDNVEDTPTLGRYAAIAAALIGLQMAIGFPLERGLRDELKKGGGGSGKDPFEAAMQQQMAAAFQTKYLPGLYLYLAALGVPVLQWIAGGRRKDNGASGADSR